VGGSGKFIFFSIVGVKLPLRVKMRVERRLTRYPNTSRLILTEGLVTVLLGIYTFFFLPDCKITFSPLSISST
jgi:hypothetical protein